MLRRNQAGSATICLMPHIRSRLLGRARRRYGADQHHQPRHTACATLLLLRVPSAATAVCSACSAFAAAVALLALCLPIACVTVCLLLSVRVCLREPLQSVHVCLSEILCQGVSFTLLLSAPRVASSRDTNLSARPRKHGHVSAALPPPSSSVICERAQSRRTKSGHLYMRRTGLVCGNVRTHPAPPAGMPSEH